MFRQIQRILPGIGLILRPIGIPATEQVIHGNGVGLQLCERIRLRGIGGQCLIDALYGGGLRLGTAAITTRGLTVADMDTIAECIALAINDFDNSKEKIRGMVTEICTRYPLYA